MTRRLLGKGYPAEEVERAVADLVADGSIDDRRMAQALARSASVVKGRGRLRIRRDLEARGISQAAAREATAALSDADELQTIARLVARKRDAVGSDPAARRRLFTQLLRRGFRSDLIARTLKVNPDDGE
jgi:regulatory protein